MKQWSDFRRSCVLAEQQLGISSGWLITENNHSSFYIFRTDNNQVLARGVPGYDAAKERASALRKRLGLKFDQVKFKVERSPGSNTGRTGSTRSQRPFYRNGRIEKSANYNKSKRGYFRGVSYPDGSYADLD